MWSNILVVLLLSISFFKCVKNLVTPVVEDLLELRKHLSWVFPAMLVLCLVFPLSVIWFEGDVLSETLQGFSQLAGELVENLGELSLLFVWTLVPVLDLEALDEWLVDLVDDSVQRGDGVLGDLSEQNIIVVSSSF